MNARRPLSTVQKCILTLAFVPMLATGIGGGVGTFSNISAKYGDGTATGAVAAGEGATAVLALVLLGLTMLGQSSPTVIRIGLWALPAAASAMAVTAARNPGEAVIYAITPMGMTVAAEGMAFLARRIVVHQDGRDVEAEDRAAAVIRALAYHRARAANHPDKKKRADSERKSWKLAQKVGAGDASLGTQLLDIQRKRITVGADAALGDMFRAAPTTLDYRPEQDTEESTEVTVNRSPSEQGEHPDSTPVESPQSAQAELEAAAPDPEPTEAAQELVTAAAEPKPSRVTRRLPKAARTTTRPKRTQDELLDQARSATTDWNDDQLTANAIRLAVRTSADNARWLRETLRTERAEEAADGRYEVA